MARAADDAEAAPVSAEDRRRWQAYRDATVRLAREKVDETRDLGPALASRGLPEDQVLNNALASRSLPRELGRCGSEAAKRARLLASLFEHPAWAYEPDAAAAAQATAANTGTMMMLVPA